METPIPNPPSPTAPDPTLRDFLAAHDAPCPNCGYNLRGIATSTCPECNRSLQLQLTGHDTLRRFNWVGWATISIALVANVLGLLQWLQFLTPLFDSRVYSRYSPSIWVGLGASFLLCVLGILWIIFVLSRSWPSPRPAVGNPFFACCIWVLASSCIHLLTLLLRLIGL